MKLTLVSSR